MSSLSFHGAAGMVTGSCYLLQHSNNPGLVIDCGMYQGVKEIQDLNTAPLGFDPSSVGDVLLTHAHLDHCGRLPLLTINGFKGNIYMTEPTRDLIEVILFDAARIAERDENVKQIYTEDDVERLLEHCEIIDFDEQFSVGEYGVTYRDAGHILGAASIDIEREKADGSFKKIVFSGDLGTFPHMMLEDPYRFSDADIVVMESTYGGRKHSDKRPIEILQKEINAVEESDGALMIPCFSIERTQEMLYLIKQLKDNAKIKLQTPVFLDSPMAIKATEIYRRYGGLYNESFHDEITKGDPFSFPYFHELERAKDGRIIDKTYGPKVIIAGSGMMNGGRILKHAKKFLSAKNNRLLFVGYQGDETLGKEILEGAREVNIFDSNVSINADVNDIDSMSAHADEDQLVAWLKNISNVKTLFLTHGEDSARDALDQKIRTELGIDTIKKPDLHDEVLISA